MTCCILQVRIEQTKRMAPQRRVPAVFMRGGTSKAIVFRRSDLPASPERWPALFLGALGSPDPNGRQLDGMGGGLSSLSKICVVGPPTRDDADLDYTFAQVSVRDAFVDFSGNCGNMASAIGPFALDEGLVQMPAGKEATVRIHNTNTGKIIIARFALDGGYAAVDGELIIDGVAGAGAPIRLDFIDPGGSKTGKLLPSGRAVDVLKIEGLGAVAVSLIDAANPCIFVEAATLGLSATESPEIVERDTALLERLETIRRHGCVAMGIAPDLQSAANMPSTPRIAWIARPADTIALSGRKISRADIDIMVRMISTGQPHRAVPLTGALCLAVACRVKGGIPHRLVGAPDGNSPVRIGHPSGVTIVDADVEDENDAPRALSASVYRTARRLFQGEVLVPARAFSAASTASEPVEAK